MINANHIEGMIALDKRDYKKAQELFLKAIEIDPQLPESYLFLGKSYFLNDEKQEAINSLKTFIKLRQYSSADVENVSYAFDMLGQCYEAENKDNEALICYQTATKINPSCASAWHNMALFYIKLAQQYLEHDLAKSVKWFKDAKFFLKNALELCSENPVFLQTVASWYEKYIEVLEQLTEEDPAVSENIIRNFNFAIQYYRKGIAACGQNDSILKNIILTNLTECLAQYGHHLYRDENYTGAQQLYLEVINLDPDHLSAINQLGMSYFKQKNFVEARSYFSKIFGQTQDKQEHADAWLNIACTYRLEKRWEEAEKALIQAKIYSPDDLAIDEEKAKLTEAKLKAIYVVSKQIMFTNSEEEIETKESKYGRDEVEENEFKI
jgi:tetratricopeptide (TPR) repeat protein